MIVIYGCHTNTAFAVLQVLLLLYWALEEHCGEGDGTPLQYSCWKIPWMEEPGRLQSMRSLGVGHD